MSDQDNDQEKLAEVQVAETFAQRVETIQERARQEGFVSDGLDHKLAMDEAWGEDTTNLNAVQRHFGCKQGRS